PSTKCFKRPLRNHLVESGMHQQQQEFVELLLQRGANVNWQDGHGRTALSYACEKGHLDAVKVLVRNNADPEVMDSWGNTALMYAAVAGHSPVLCPRPPRARSSSEANHLGRIVCSELL
uniref:Uncharacterized protein n=1 Tax=Mola mola TaxID=94237 RepID=A0A3Q3W237_MOLML